jgi:hypothetical protein
MADQRDQLAQTMAQNTGGLTPGDFATFSQKLNDPTALQGWLDKGGIYGQNGGPPPDPLEQYFAPKGTPSGGAEDTGWMGALQPGQGGASGDLPGSGMNTSGFIGGGSMTRADPSYWGWQGPHQGFSPGSPGAALSGGGGGGGTGGLTPGDFATFSKALNNPTALQDWLSKGGIYGQSGGNRTADTLNPFANTMANTLGYGGLGHSIGATLGGGISPSGGASLGGSALGNTAGPGVGDGGW